MTNRFTIEIKPMANFIDYSLLDDHGCVAAKVSSYTYTDRFKPTEETCIDALYSLVPIDSTVTLRRLPKQ